MRFRFPTWIAVVLMAASLLTIGCWRSDETDSGGPEDAPAGAEASFVGNQRCAECHSLQAEQYASTGHARTFALTRNSSLAEALDGTTYRDPERDVTYHYHYAPRDGLSVTIPEVFGSDAFPLPYELGSNQHAATFLALISDLAGQTVGIEHRVTVFGGDLRLDVTPGQRGEPVHEQVQWFGKHVPPDTLRACIGCHTTTARIQDTQVVDLRANVSCESCHGPGSRHVAAMNEGLAETQIESLRPADPLSSRRQIEVCGECHRMPDDISPDDLHPENAKLARFQPVGLLKSRCFEESGGRLSCSTCHDPHARPADQQENFVDACLKCHRADEPEQTACPVSPRQDCIGCHMPPTEVHPGIHFHDHWIRVR